MNPLREILENYVLAAIGSLSPGRSQDMAQLVRHAYGGGIDWQATLRGNLGLSADTDAQFRAMWAAARKDDPHLPAHDFARLVVQENFAPLLK